jgi:C4-dicarboxylate-specific signal transduction histidine kinase
MELCSILLLILIVVGLYNIVLYRESKDKIEEEMQKRLEQERQQFRQNRLRAMGEMMSNIGHHWKQPLNNIAILVLNIEKNYRADKLTQSYLDEKIEAIEDTIEQMSSVVEDFKKYLTPTTKRELFSINYSIEIAIMLVSSTLKSHNIEIKFEADGDYNYYGRKNELTQVLTLIINNAKDALIKNSTNRERTITIKLKKIEEQIRIIIEDSGEGVPQDIIHKLFDPYFTTKHKTQGRGLSLYIAKMIILEEFNGVIDVYNNSSGAVFELRLLNIVTKP